MTEEDGEMIEASLRGGNCNPDQEILEEYHDQEHPSPAEQVERANHIDGRIQEAQEAGKSILEPEIKQEIEKMTPDVAQRFVEGIKDDQPISVLPSISEFQNSNEILEFKEKYLSSKDTVVVVEHTAFFDSKVKGSEKTYPKDVQPVIHFDIPVTTRENLEKMKDCKPPLGKDGNPFEIHHWRREDKAPFFAMERATHRGPKGISKELHKYEPSERVDRGKFTSRREKFWEWEAREYLGPWTDYI